jgi:thioredoxin 2
MPVIRSCPTCRKSNRVPARHLADEGRCGSCQGALPPLAEPLEPEPAVFDEVVREAAVPVLIDFWAAWCGPCRMVAPEVEKAAASLAGRAVVVKVDTEKHPELASRYGVQAIPNFVILRDGQVVLQRPGFAPQAQIEDWIRAASARAPGRP